MIVIIQDFGSLDIWAIIGKAGGAVGLLLAIAVYVLWKDNKDKELAIAKLNAQSQADAKESIRVLTSLEKLNDHVLSELERIESRVVTSVKSEAAAVKDLIHVFKEEVSKRIDGQDHRDQ